MNTPEKCDQSKQPINLFAGVGFGWAVGVACVRRGRLPEKTFEIAAGVGERGEGWGRDRTAMLAANAAEFPRVSGRASPAAADRLSNRSPTSLATCRASKWTNPAL